MIDEAPGREAAALLEQAGSDWLEFVSCDSFIIHPGLKDLLMLAAGAAEGVPVLAAVLMPDRWLLELGVLFVLSVLSV